MSVEYEVESYEVVVVTSVCSPENTICCSGYTMVLNSCISNDICILTRVEIALFLTIVFRFIDSTLAGNLGGLIDLGIIG